MENSVGKFKAMLERRDLRNENAVLKARISELEAVLEQNNIHVLSKDCWCKPEVATGYMCTCCHCGNQFQSENKREVNCGRCLPSTTE